MKQKVAIIDYGMGNLFSVQKKLRLLNCETIISKDINELSKADKIILPGVGHFGKAISNLKDYGLIDLLTNEVSEKKKPILGICLGMQLMTTFSEEGSQNGLNWIQASVKHFNISNTLKFKVPHTGWNKVIQSKSSSLLKGIPDLSEFYFVHSYYVECKNSTDELLSTNYETSFTSAIEKDNLFGVQFHPEKSHDAGMQLFKNFIDL